MWIRHESVKVSVKEFYILHDKTKMLACCDGVWIRRIQDSYIAVQKGQLVEFSKQNTVY